MPFQDEMTNRPTIHQKVYSNFCKKKKFHFVDDKLQFCIFELRPQNTEFHLFQMWCSYLMKTNVLITKMINQIKKVT